MQDMIRNMTRKSGFLFLLWSLLVTSLLEGVDAFLIAPSSTAVLRLSTISVEHPSVSPCIGLRMSTEDSSKIQSASSDESTVVPKPAVKCPDCDLCDGSGRYETPTELLF